MRVKLKNRMSTSMKQTNANLVIERPTSYGISEHS